MEKLIHNADGSLVSTDPFLQLGNKFMIYGDPMVVGVVTQDSIDKTVSWRQRHSAYLESGGHQQAYLGFRGASTRYKTRSLALLKD